MRALEAHATRNCMPFDGKIEIYFVMIAAKNLLFLPYQNGKTN